jgi:tellurite resistance protein TehA-like permease
MSSPRLGPNWFAAVMGTGIVANAAMLLPIEGRALHGLAIVAWLVAVVLLILLVAITATHPRDVRRHLANPAMAPFFGAPAMAVLTVASGTLLVGGDLIGAHAAARIAAVLWVVGTAAGLAVALVVPARLLRGVEGGGDGRRDGGRWRAVGDAVAAPWLLAVVPPVVSAAAGAGLVAHLPAGAPRAALLAFCAAELLAGTTAAAVLIVLLARKIARHGVGERRLIPTLWIVLGPLGQTVTAANLLAHAANDEALRHVALVYGFGVLGFAMLWLAGAATITLQALREGLPFSLTWWSFTFPVGTCVTGTSAMVTAGAPHALTGLAVALFALLLTAWIAAAAGTLRGVADGRLLRPAV